MSELSNEIQSGLGRSQPSDRLKGRVAIVVGAGQSPGVATGNGKAAALVYAKEGASVLAVDARLDAAQETVDSIAAIGGSAKAFTADVTDEATIISMVSACMKTWGKIDILHNNVGVSKAAGDTTVMEMTPEIFDRVMAINLRSMILTSKHVLPIMHEQKSGVITNISTIVAYSNISPRIAYKTSKAGVIALTQNLAITHAEFNVRANVILPGQINTPMNIESQVAVEGEQARDMIMARVSDQVPLGKKMGDAWDIGYAALFLASDEARFITGISLVVDGGQSLKVG